MCCIWLQQPTGARKKDKVLQGFTVFGMISCIQYTATNLQFHDTLNWPVCNSESPTAALSLAYQDPRERYQEHIRKAAEFFPTQLFHHRTWWRSRTPTSLSRATGPQPCCTVHATMEAVRSTIFENINLLQSIKDIYHNLMDDGNLKKTSSVNFPKTKIKAFLHHAPCHAQSPVALFAAGSKEAITSARNCASQLLNKGRRSKHSSSLTVLAGKRNEEVFQLPTAFWTQMLWWSFGLLFFWCWFIGWRPRHQHQVGCLA